MKAAAAFARKKWSPVLAIALLTWDGIVDRSALQFRRWQLIVVS